MEGNNTELQRLVSRKEMQAMDRYAIEVIGIPEIVLMENAALKIFGHLDVKQNQVFSVVCGTGNNGGDGLAVARHLILEGKTVYVFVIGEVRADQVSEAFRINHTILRCLKADMVTVSSEEDLESFTAKIKKSDLVLDAIFGIGIDREVKGIHYDVIKRLNQYVGKIVSVDIPSGVDADSGKVHGIAVKATKTITLQYSKKGLIGIPEYTGEIVIEKIGIPETS